MTETKRDTLKGWKVFDENLQCRGFQFEVGKAYEATGELKMCVNGFHFHHDGQHLFNYYDNTTRNRVCEIEAQDVLVGDDKAVCRKITVVRELGLFEVSRVAFGYGNGYGYGYGYGFGYGFGYGDGNGNGYGFGYGYGDGNGYGNGKYGSFPDFIHLEEQAA